MPQTILLAGVTGTLGGRIAAHLLEQLGPRLITDERRGDET